MESAPASFIEESFGESSADQLSLPLSTTNVLRRDVWDGDRSWPTPHHVLANYLEQLRIGDPAEVAGQLLRDFGSISDLLAASWWSLRASIGGRLASIICASRDLMRAALLEEAASGPIISNRREVVNLLQAELGSLRRERVIALYVDTKLRLLRLERIAEGSVRDTPLDVRRIIHRGLDVGAAGLMLVHNHPSGDASPSESDRRAMARLRHVAADCDMHLLDALVVAGGEIRSVFER